MSVVRKNREMNKWSGVLTQDVYLGNSGERTPLIIILTGHLS